MKLRRSGGGGGGCGGVHLSGAREVRITDDRSKSPYIFPTSPICLPCISPTSPLYLSYISRISPVYLPHFSQVLITGERQLTAALLSGEEEWGVRSKMLLANFHSLLVLTIPSTE